MNLKSLFCIAAVAAITVSCGLSRKTQAPHSFDTADWNWQEIAKDATKGGVSAEVGSAQFRIFESMQNVSVIRYKEGTLHMDVINDPAEQSDSTSAMAIRHGAIAAVNGSYFNMRALTPVTYILEDGQVEGETTVGELFRVEGVVAVKGDRVDIFPCAVEGYAAVAENYDDAMAAGPMLLVGGEAYHTQWPEDRFCDVRHPRTIVGKSADGWVYLMVIDGRSWGNAEGATLAECIEICKLFGITDALNLDGGGSSALWTASTGVVSCPSDDRRFDHFGQRVVPNILILK